MDVSMMQPAFIPWQGFFELICRSQCFIILDDFQFSIQGREQRNRLFVNKGQVGWYTVPIRRKVSFKHRLDQTAINETLPWRIKMWKRIEANYSKAEFFKMISSHIKELLLKTYDSLAAQNMALIRMICELLGFEKEFRFSSDYPVSAQRSVKVLELLRWCHADRYYSARGSFAYMLEDEVFPVSDIEVLFQDFKPVPYRQVGAVDDFVPLLSIVDALMNVGPAKTAELVKSGTQKWWTWEEMLNEKKILNENS